MNGSSPSSLPARGASPDDWARELSGQLEFLRRLARSLVRDEQIAEDMVQEAMLAAVARPPDRSLGLRVWLQSVLRRSILLHFRSEQRRVARETLLLRERRGRDEALDEAEHALTLLERGTMLGQAVGRLRDPYRTVVVLRFYEGLQPREIARCLDRSVHTVHTQLQRGIQKLREDLDAVSGGDRGVWMGALLPLALHGRDGWWPSAVQVPVGSSGILAAAALVLATVAGLWHAAGLVDTGASGAVRVAGAPDPGREDRVGVEAPGEDSPRGAVPLPVAAAEQAPSPDGAQRLRIQVRSPRGALAGARVVATQRSSFPATSSRIVSPLVVGDGRVLEIHSGGLRILDDPPDQAELQTVERTTGSDGRVELALHGERPWTIRVDAEGHASELLQESIPFPTQEQVVRLEPAGEVVLARGSFSLDSNVYCRLESGFEGISHDVLLPGGQQEVRMTGVRPGSYRFEAVSAGGAEVAQWNFDLLVALDDTHLVDLSRGGLTPVELDVQGGDGRPLYVHAHGPVGSLGKPAWHVFAPAHSGLARFEGLPRGPAVLRVLSRDAEIARLPVVVDEASGVLRVSLSVPSGTLRVLHPGLDGSRASWLLARRSDGKEALDGWFHLGEPRTGPGESLYQGLSPGTYRLWVTHAGATRAFDLEHDGGALELDAASLAPLAGELVPLRVVRGSGLYPEAPIELEVQPGRWTSIGAGHDRLRLPPGTYRLRIPLLGLGYATREVEIPRQRSVTFEEPSALRSVEVTGPPAGGPRRLLVVSADGPTLHTSRRSLELTLDAGGMGRIELRPGTYPVQDRWGPAGVLEIAPGEATGRILLD